MTENKISFDAMPEMLATIAKRLEVIETKVDHLSQPQSHEEKDVWFNVHGLRDYLPSHPAEQTIYGWTRSHFIPFHKQGKSISFLKSEIDEWLCQGKKKSLLDLQHEAEEFVNRKHKRV